MYSIDWGAIRGFARRRALRRTIGPSVWALGATSLLTDVSSEMVASVLPMYLVLQLGVSPVAFGLIDGLYQGMAALVRILGGVVADRSRRYKQLAALGYGISAACRLLMLSAGSVWTTIGAVVAIDRIGKGLRTAPRDALLSLNSRSDDLATTFGVHRALDAAGAFIGPVVAFVLLAQMEDAFDVLFVTSFVVAALGVVVLALFVEPTRPPGLATSHNAQVASRSAWTVVRQPRLLALVACAFLLGLATISDSFLFLSLKASLQSAATAFPLFYVGTSLATSLFAVPAGRVADRHGRSHVLLGGYVCLAIAYLGTLVPASVPGAILCLLFLGGHYAATDGVLTAMAAAELPAAARGSGLAVLATAANVARLLASVAFGALWSTLGMRAATWVYTALLLSSIATSLFLLRTVRNDAR